MSKQDLHPETSRLISHETGKRASAFLISTYSSSSQKETCQEHLEELALLVDTYGAQTLSKESCPLRKCEAATFLGKGKLDEYVSKASSLQADLIIFDDEITPAQQRNLQQAFGRPVLDRTEVILEVFAARAKTKEARLQIELAKLKYEAPRLKRLWTHLSRQQGTSGSGGGGGYLKGEGEKQIEIDRRILKQKIDQVEKEIEEVKAHRQTQHLLRLRSQIPSFAIIGYTNAGKSTLLNALTDADVLVEDKLFATLDTTTRKFTLKNQQDILLIDTVGFIRKLPHLLVAAFKSTLEESAQADILLHLIDVSHPMAEEQAKTTYEVLKELHASEKPIISVFNKIDKQVDPSRLLRLRMSYPKNVQISALTGEGFDELQELMIQAIRTLRKQITARIPQKEYAVACEVMRLGHVLDQEYEGDDLIIRAEVPLFLANKMKPWIC